MKAGVGLVLEEAAAEAQDADKLWPIADGGLGGGKTGEELNAEGKRNTSYSQQSQPWCWWGVGQAFIKML